MSASQPHRQYGNIFVSGTGLTINGDVYNSGTLFRTQSDTDEVTKYGLCFGSAPQISPTYFVGRDAEIDEMSRILEPTITSTQQRRLVLGGMGGIGKTQLAIAYAKRKYQSYDSVFWLNATTRSTLNADLRLVVGLFLQAKELERLDDNQILTRFHEWLSNTRNPRWLLVFDNYDEPDQFDISSYCPYTACGSIVITTRLPECVHLSSHHLRVQPMSNVEESLDILYKRSQRERIADDSDARRLAERLAGFPLALATVGAYLNQSASITFQQYLNIYEQHWNVDPYRPLQLQEYRNRTLYTTWNISYTRLKSDDPYAAQLLKLLAYFDNQNVWYELLSATIATAPSLRLRRSLTFLGLSRNPCVLPQQFLSDRVRFDSAMRILLQYCFVDIQNATHSYSMHNCIHDWTMAELNKSWDAKLYWYAFDCVAARTCRIHYDSFSNIKHNRLAPHAAHLMHQKFSEAWLVQTTKRSRINNMVSVAIFLTEQAQLRAAEQMYLLALATSEKILGPTHLSTLQAIHNLGVLYLNQDKLDKSEQMFARALVGSEKSLGLNHISTLRTANMLGYIYYSQGKLEQADRMYQRVLSAIENVLEPDDRFALDTMNMLGILYAAQGKQQEAEQIHLEVLTKRGEILGPNNVLTFESTFNLGLVYLTQDRLDEAEQIFLGALARFEPVVGPNHIFLLDTASKLGVVYAKQGKLQEAEQMYQRALAGKERALGSDHRSTLETLGNLRLLIADQDELDEVD